MKKHIARLSPQLYCKYTGDILQVAEKIYFMAKVSTTPFSLRI